MVRLALDHSPSELHFPPSDAGRAAPPPSRHEGAFHPMSLGPPVHQFSWGSTLEKPSTPAPPTLPSTISSGSTSFQSGIPLRVRVQTELDDARLEGGRRGDARACSPRRSPSRRCCVAPRELARRRARGAARLRGAPRPQPHDLHAAAPRVLLAAAPSRFRRAPPDAVVGLLNHTVPGPRTVLDQYGGVLSPPPRWSKAPTTARARHRHPVQQAIGVRLPPLRDPLLDPLRAAAGAGAATVTAAAAARRRPSAYTRGQARRRCGGQMRNRETD